MTRERTARGVRLEPTWRGLLPAFLAVLEHGTDEGKRLAKLELARMALAADRYNEDHPHTDQDDDG